MSPHHIFRDQCAARCAGLRGHAEPIEEIRAGPVSHFPADVTRQTVFPTSSAIRSAPVLSIATATGRPCASPLAFRNPVTTSSALPFGRPPLNGTKTTLYPLKLYRSQLPCSPTKAPPRYFWGRLSTV